MSQDDIDQAVRAIERHGHEQVAAAALRLIDALPAAERTSFLVQLLAEADPDTLALGLLERRAAGQVRDHGPGELRLGGRLRAGRHTVRVDTLGLGRTLWLVAHEHPEPILEPVAQLRCADCDRRYDTMEALHGHRRIAHGG